MTASDVDKIESELGIAVPIAYRNLVTDYPAELPEVARGYDLLDHPAYVISENRTVRQAPGFGMQWPDQYFIVGQDGAGGLFCIDLFLKESPVFYFDHEDRSFREVARTLVDWVPIIAEVHAR